MMASKSGKVTMEIKAGPALAVAIEMSEALWDFADSVDGPEHYEARRAIGRLQSAADRLGAIVRQASIYGTADGSEGTWEPM